MKVLTTDAQAKIAEQYGDEPIYIIAIAWVEGGLSYYADRNIDTLNAKGQILEISDLDAIVNIMDSSDSQSISLTLDDIDGNIKNIINNHDVYKRDVFVYQWFEGLELADLFLLFRGKINSPLVWNEGKRTISFTVISQIEDIEVGFSPEEGEFPNIPSDLVDQPWPSCFGTVIDSKTVRLTDRVSGILGDGFGLPDFTISSRMAALFLITEYLKPIIRTPDGPRIIRDYYAGSSYYAQFLNLKYILGKQNATVRRSFRVFGGEDFPRGPIILKIGECLAFGSFNDNVFNVTRYQHPDRINFPPKIFPYAVMVTPIFCYDEGIWGFSGCTTLTPYFNGQINGDSSSYIYNSPGATVKLHGYEYQKYVVSIVPGQVIKASAWVQKEGQHFIQDIPEDLYEVTTVNFGPVNAVLLSVYDALSKRKDEGWSDDIYVTFQSDIGPNTVDILKYIIQTYTDFEIDDTSFDHVHTKIENYPSHFTLSEKKNVLEVLEEIAWQARCSIYLKNNKFYIQYLPEEQASVSTITEDDIVVDTLELSHTDTEDLVTKMICSWKHSGMQDKPFKTVLRHNIRKYGTHEQNYDFYIYNYGDAVVKSATFWIIRYSNTWKKLSFETPLQQMFVESLDSVTLDFTNNYVADSSILAYVESSKYNSASNTMTFECWCPVKTGTMETYVFAYPADAPIWEQFPTEWEVQHGFEGGSGPNAAATGELPKRNVSSRGRGGGGGSIRTRDDPRHIGDPFNLIYSEDDGTEHDRLNNTRGNPSPSDLGDGYPEPQIIRPAESLGPDTPAGDAPPYEGGAEEKQQGFGQQALGDMFPDADLDEEEGLFDPSDLPDPDDVEDNPCNFTVTVSYIEVTRVGDIWPGSTTPGATGYLLSGTGTAKEDVHVFKNCESAKAFALKMIEFKNGPNAVVGGNHPWSIQPVQPSSWACGIYDEECGTPLESNNDYGMVAYRDGGQSGWSTFSSYYAGEQ